MTVSIGPGYFRLRGHGTRKNRKTASTAMRDRIFERDGNRCLRCDSPHNLQVDHILPVAAGGTNDDSNLQTLCERCNTRKGNRSISYLAPEAA